MNKFTKRFNDIVNEDITIVGKKNILISDLFQHLSSKGVNIPNGFAITSDAYWSLLEHNCILKPLQRIVNTIDYENLSNIRDVSKKIQTIILKTHMHKEFIDELSSAYQKLKERYIRPIQVTVRVSDLFENGFEHKSYLNLSTSTDLINACISAYANYFSEESIKYRIKKNYKQFEYGVALSIQRMIRSDMASSGLAYSTNPINSNNKEILIRSCWGLGELFKFDFANYDEFVVSKEAIELNKLNVLKSEIGTKEGYITYVNKGVDELETKEYTKSDENKKNILSIDNNDIYNIALMCNKIEKYFKKPIVVEWAKEPITKDIYLIHVKENIGNEQALKLAV